MIKPNLENGDRTVVAMSLNEYNSWQATMHVVSPEANRTALGKAIQQYREGKMQERDLTRIMELFL